MEIFYSTEIDGQFCSFNPEESLHMVKVLRHKAGDEISVVDGKGTMYTCELVEASPKQAQARIVDSHENWGEHDYCLTLGVCPTKNNDRYEWFAEKAAEIGLDAIVPLIGDHSERKVFKKERVERILVSAMKQSLKSSLPEIRDAVKVMDYIEEVKEDHESLKLIAYCFEGEQERISIKEALSRYEGKSIIVLIGPEGDFSVAEAEAAVKAGFIPVHLGSSRLRTETAAVTAAEAAYFRYM